MSLKEWEGKEIMLACKKENPNRKNDEWDYGCACYESALKAFNSLLDDGHSGMSMAITKSILNRLIDCKPLTPIEDTDDIWNESYYDEKNECQNYQCKRMSSLFKSVYKDGKIEYSETDRFICVDINNKNNRWHNGFVCKKAEEYVGEIKMPYYPLSKSYEIYCNEFLYDEKNGDFDTIGIIYILSPNGEKIKVNRYFKAGEKSFVEIDEKEYELRLKNKIK